MAEPDITGMGPCVSQTSMPRCLVVRVTAHGHMFRLSPHYELMGPGVEGDILCDGWCGSACHCGSFLWGH